MEGKLPSFRFGSYQEMADYMKSNGYVWDNKQQNYKKVVIAEAKVQQEATDFEKLDLDNIGAEKVHQCDCVTKYNDLLKFIEANKDKLTDLLNTVEESGMKFPRYVLHGYTITKSIDIPKALDRLIIDYKNDKNVSQKEIVQVALIEFFKQYGYAKEVSMVLKTK